MWFKERSKHYVLDYINFGIDFDQQIFQFRFNPKHPVAFLKLNQNLCFICLPGKRHETTLPAKSAAAAPTVVVKKPTSKKDLANLAAAAQAAAAGAKRKTTDLLPYSR